IYYIYSSYKFENQMLTSILLISPCAFLTACIVVEYPVPVVVNKDVTTPIDYPINAPLDRFKEVKIRTYDNRCFALCPFNERELLASRCQNTSIRSWSIMKIKA
ncbi:hypothetical protein ACG9ZB_16790, partial [Acinetobacter johnsonii]